MLLALTDELRYLDIPHKVFGQRNLPGSHGAKIICSECGQLKTMAGRVNGQSLCAGCRRKHPEIVRPCGRCSHRDYLSRERLCRGCRAKDSVATALADILEKWPTLKETSDVLLAANGRELHHMLKARKLPTLLRELTDGRTSVTHDALDSLGRDAGTRVLRSFLVAYGALPERNEHLLNFESWVDARAEEIGDTSARRAFVRFARWRHLRQVRTAVLSPAQWAWRRRELKMVQTFLGFLHERGLTLRTARQHDVDQWLARGNTSRRIVRTFLLWCRTSGINPGLESQYPQRMTLSIPSASAETERVRLLRQSLEPDAIPDPGLRLAAALVVLYGFRPHQIAKLRVEDIVLRDRHAVVCFGPDPLELPELLAGYALQAKAQRTIRRLGGTGEDNEWLYPGRVYGSPITADTMSHRLAAVGISAEIVRSAALGQLALQLPPAVLARLTGMGREAATRWYAAVSAGNARNLPRTNNSFTPTSHDPAIGSARPSYRLR